MSVSPPDTARGGTQRPSSATPSTSGRRGEAIFFGAVLAFYLLALVGLPLILSATGLVG